MSESASGLAEGKRRKKFQRGSQASISGSQSSRVQFRGTARNDQLIMDIRSGGGKEMSDVLRGLIITVGCSHVGLYGFRSRICPITKGISAFN